MRKSRFLLCRSHDSFTRFLVLASLIVVSSSSSAVDTESDGWQILTKTNFSSSIRMHPHLLLLVTVPWSGESRSLMKKLAHMVTERDDRFGSLKLMYLYRNSEKMVANALGASGSNIILYYHHSVSYEYRGRLRAQNILSSVYSLMPVSPEELPLAMLNSRNDLNAFLESTEKSVLLLEFCGWTSVLLAKGNTNGIENTFGIQEVFGSNISGYTNRTPTLGEPQIQKGMQNEDNICSVESGFNGFSWLAEFSLVNKSTPFFDDGLSCTLEEFRSFESFFQKFTTTAREFFLPVQRQRFGLVSDISLLSTMGVGDHGSWLTMVYFAGCPNCSKIINKADELGNLLQMRNPLVMELEDGDEIEPGLPGNKPFILLFVDRSSELSRVRTESEKVLKEYRKLALQYQLSLPFPVHHNRKPQKTSANSNQASRIKSHSVIRKDKKSIMIVNEGGHVSLETITPNLQDRHVQKILSYLLQQKTGAKLSSLAKQAGFELLSEDLDIKIVDTSPSETDVQSNHATSEQPMKIAELDKDQLREIASFVKQSKVAEAEPAIESSTETISEDQHEPLIAEDVKVEKVAEDANSEADISSQKEKSVAEQLLHEGFEGSFYFSDGNYRLLRSLTAGSRIPSMVIIDPISQKHYVFPEESSFSYSSLADFLDAFLNGSLLPYQQSEPAFLSARDTTHPPFLNLDFHEAESIPRVTAHTFSDLVLGFNQSDTNNHNHAWKKDVLVLFINSWCGFCQRMELVVREVFRSLKGYRNILKNRSRKAESVLNNDDVKDVMLKFPLIYLLDCTLNDCSSILKSSSQRELYPALVLFPAEKKKALSYEGDMAVTEIIKFIAAHGRNSHGLFGEEGVLWTNAEKGGEVPEETLVSKDEYHEVLLKNRTPKREKYKSNGLHETSPVAVGSILTATDKLFNVHPFDQSSILIVMADQNIGFKGLIINKRINWDTFNEVEPGLESIREAPLSFGGPLIKRGMPLISLTRNIIQDQYPEVSPGVYFLDQFATLNVIEGFKSGNQSVSDHWFFFGYSSWEWDQLYDEIAQGSWKMSDEQGYVDWPSS